MDDGIRIESFPTQDQLTQMVITQLRLIGRPLTDLLKTNHYAVQTLGRGFLSEGDQALLESLLGLREGSKMQRVVFESEMGLEKLAVRAVTGIATLYAVRAAVDTAEALYGPHSAPESVPAEPEPESVGPNVTRVDFRARKRLE